MKNKCILKSTDGHVGDKNSEPRRVVVDICRIRSRDERTLYLRKRDLDALFVICTPLNSRLGSSAE